jgi:RNA 2',3'-cyclic 3'-phosphodiesterase
MIRKPMPRLFAGLELPETARSALADLEGPLPGAGWHDEDDLHLTLRFAGDVDGAVARDYAEFLADIDHPAFTLRFSGLGTFGGAQPRVLFAGFASDPPLLSLHRAVERAARKAGMPPEPRRFAPHVTLARLRGTPPEAVAGCITSHLDFRLPPFEVASLALFSARPGGGGPYVVEERFPLRGGSLDEDGFADAWSDEEEAALNEEILRWPSQNS